MTAATAKTQFNLSVESNQNVESKRKSVEFRNKKKRGVQNFAFIKNSKCSLTIISGEIKIVKMRTLFQMLRTAQWIELS